MPASADMGMPGSSMPAPIDFNMPGGQVPAPMAPFGDP